MLLKNKDEWLLLPAIFTAKLGFDFVLTLENAFFRGFILKPTERAEFPLQNSTRGLQNSPPFERSACFYVIIYEKFKLFQCFNFAIDFLENENLF